LEDACDSGRKRNSLRKIGTQRLTEPNFGKGKIALIKVPGNWGGRTKKGGRTLGRGEKDQKIMSLGGTAPPPPIT